MCGKWGLSVPSEWTRGLGITIVGTRGFSLPSVD